MIYQLIMATLDSNFDYIRVKSIQKKVEENKTNHQSTFINLIR